MSGPDGGADPTNEARPGPQSETEKEHFPESPPLSPKELRRRLRSSPKIWLIAILAGLVALLFWGLNQAANLAQLVGPFWPVDPEIEFHDTINASSTVLPFKMTNKSTVFSIDRAQVTCGVDLIYFVDANRRTGTLRDSVFVTRELISLKRNGGYTNYPCTASNYIKIRDDGSALIGFEDGQNLVSPPGAFRAPITVLKMCLWIRGTYSTLGYPMSFRSKMFQWPAAPGQRQWIEGPITPDLPNEAWIPPDSHIGPVWAMRQMMTPDMRAYLPGALQCTRM
jgi:hypothetical protein